MRTGPLLPTRPAFRSPAAICRRTSTRSRRPTQPPASLRRAPALRPRTVRPGSPGRAGSPEPGPSTSPSPRAPRARRGRGWPSAPSLCGAPSGFASGTLQASRAFASCSSALLVWRLCVLGLDLAWGISILLRIEVLAGPGGRVTPGRRSRRKEAACLGASVCRLSLGVGCDTSLGRL